MRIKRMRATAARAASPPAVRRDASDVRNLPIAPPRSAHVAPRSLAEQLRDVRARAERILREHPRHDCDAAHVAEDVIAITSRLATESLATESAKPS